MSRPSVTEIGMTFLRCSICEAPTMGETIMPSCCRLVPMPTQKSDPEIEWR